MGDFEQSWTAGWRNRQSTYRLRLDPWVEAQARAMQQVQGLLNPVSI